MRLVRPDRPDLRDRIYQPPLVSLPPQFPPPDWTKTYLPRYSKAGLILDQGTAIWLHAHPDVLAERVQRRDTRPLLRGRDARQVLTDLAAQREPFYAQAPIHVASRKGPHETTVSAILKAIGL